MISMVPDVHNLKINNSERSYSTFRYKNRVVNRAGLFGSGSGSGLTFMKTSGFFWARYDAFKKQNYFATLYSFYVH